MTFPKARAREICERATEGEWEVGPYYGRDGHGFGDIVYDVLCPNVVIAQACDLKDAIMIVESRSLLPAAYSMSGDRDRIAEIRKELSDVE